MNTRKTLYVEKNNLFIGKFSAAELVEKFGTPLYVMDAEYLAEVCDAFSETMEKSYSHGAVAFASKAFATVATSKLIQKHGLWFDSVSGGELYLLNKAGVDKGHIIFHGNAKTEREIEEAVDLGIKYFAIDSFSEIERVDKYAGEKGIKQEVIVRVNPGVSAHTYAAVQTATPLSKFGFGIDGNAFDVIKYIRTKRNLVFKGLHFHIGSQIYEHSSYESAIEITLDFVKKLNDAGVEVETLDFGGGYGIYYTDEDPKFTPKRYAYTLKNICLKLSEQCALKGIKEPFLIVEPGRSIVGEAGVTLYTVNAIKDFPGIKKYVAVDGGMFENPRHALYGSQYSASVANRAGEGQTDIVTIAGKCCESGDIISKDIPLQKAEVGDIIAVFSTGAYNYSMASNYNFNAVPPVVLVDGDKADYIVKPQSYEDLLRRDVTPSWVE